MERILMDLTVSNFGDVLTGRSEVRCIEIKEALVDTGAAMLSLRKGHIEQLGLRFLRTVKVETANDSPERNVYGVVSVKIQGREGEFDVLEVPDDVPVLVGYLILEQLDFVANCSSHTITPNPAHGGEYALDLY